MLTHYEAVKKEVEQVSAAFAKHAGNGTDRPFLMIVASAPQTGKSTFVTALKNKGFFPTNTRFIFGDAFMHIIDAADRYELHHPEISPKYFKTFSALREKLLKHEIGEKQNIVLESHLQDMPELKELVDYARQQGYEIIGAGLTTNVENIWHEGEGKKFNPESSAERRKQRIKWAQDFAQRWNEFGKCVDDLSLYHIAFDKQVDEWSTKIKLIAHGNSQSQHIVDKKAYDEFNKWETAPTPSTLSELQEHFATHARSKDICTGMAERTAGGYREATPIGSITGGTAQRLKSITPDITSL